MQSRLGIKLWTSAFPFRLCFGQFLEVLGQNEIADFLSKARAFQPYAFRCDILLILLRRSLNQMLYILRVAFLKMQYFTLTSDLSSSSSHFDAINPVFSYRSYKLFHRRCYGQSLI